MFLLILLLILSMISFFTFISRNLFILVGLSLPPNSETLSFSPIRYNLSFESLLKHGLMFLHYIYFSFSFCTESYLRVILTACSVALTKGLLHSVSRRYNFSFSFLLTLTELDNNMCRTKPYTPQIIKKGAATIRLIQFSMHE